MNTTALRRLNTEHKSLHSSPLPPNYLFPPTPAAGPVDDLTHLVLLLAGPEGTPYGQGVWKLQLKFPEDYPRNPPKATFKTRIWHPNVDETTGSVCVDTLKRDWTAQLTVRDILITISCLLIHPNPDSALNSSAGQLLQEDYDSFARHAKLMTSIHAVVHKDLKAAVHQARRRGDVAEKTPPSTNKPAPAPAPASTGNDDVDGDDAEDDEISAGKENDPSLSPSPVNPSPPSTSPRRTNVLGKRPLSALPAPADPDCDEEASDEEDTLSPSDRNIANNVSGVSHSSPPSHSRKSPKLSESVSTSSIINLATAVNSSSAPTAKADVGKDAEEGSKLQGAQPSASLSSPSSSPSLSPPSSTTQTQAQMQMQAQTREGKENHTAGGAGVAGNRSQSMPEPRNRLSTSSTLTSFPPPHTTSSLSSAIQPPSNKRTTSTSTTTSTTSTMKARIASGTGSISARGGKARVGLRRL